MLDSIGDADDSKIEWHYSGSSTSKEYKINGTGKVDVTEAITNQRQYTKEYEWHLLWLDHYRYQNGQRP